MKILLLNWKDTSHPKAGGAERVSMEHAKAWVKQGHSVDFFTSMHTSAQPFELIDGVRVIRKGGAYTLYLFAAAYLLGNSKKYDIIIDEIHALPFFSFFVFRKPVVAFIHEVAGDIWDTMFFYPLNKLGKLSEPLLLRIYNLRKIPFWTDSPSMVNELVDLGIDRKRCIAIPCPITNAISHKWIEKEKFPTFLFVSRVVRMKGIEDVISAFSFIKEKEPKARLDIVGGGDESYIRKLRRIINSLGLDTSVTFYGKVPEEEKLRLMGKAHVLLHASIKEGWALVVLEAASQGTPSVVYNVAGLRDVVKNGKTGIVLEKNSPEELGKQALALYWNKKQYKEFQKNGKEWVASLRWDDVTKQSLDLLKKTVEKNET